jgi:formate-nitrite transporter family protein
MDISMDDLNPIELNEPEIKDIEKRSAPRAAVVYETIRQEGMYELSRPTSALGWSGLAAGLSMGFSFLTEALLQAHIPDVPWRTLISKLGYSIGFLIVILGRQQLFTENTLTPILPLLLKPSKKLLFNIIRLWSVVLISNVIGAFLFALILTSNGLFSENINEALGQIGLKAIEGSVGIKLIKSVFAGWLIALIVWLLPFAESARVLVIIIITYIIGIGHFNHIIAGSVETLYSTLKGDIAFGSFLSQFFLPTLVGNILGGVSLVAALNHAQVTSGLKD